MLAIGLVVDDAIVVVEAVERHIEEGMSPKDATFKAMEEISGPVDRHRAGPLRGVRADRVHPRHHRAAVSAVRGDHRDLGDPLGVQRAHAQPGARGAAAEAEDERARGCCGGSSTGSTACSGARPTATSAASGALIRKSAVAFALLLACGGLAAFFGGTAAVELSAG